MPTNEAELKEGDVVQVSGNLVNPGDKSFQDVTGWRRFLVQAVNETGLDVRDLRWGSNLTLARNYFQFERVDPEEARRFVEYDEQRMRARRGHYAGNTPEGE
jgi:hypothetical protein